MGGQSPGRFFSRPTTYHYDTSNRLTRVENSQAGTADDITVTYDLLGRKTSMSDPDMGTWHYTYDENGNLITQTDGRGDTVQNPELGQTVYFTYDELNRPLFQYDTDDTGDRISKWEYDFVDTAAQVFERGLLSQSKSYENDTLRVTVDPLGYDARGRVTSTKWTVAGQGAGNWTVSQTYDEADRIESLTYPTGEVVTYSYSDDTGLPESLDTDQGDVIVANASWTDQGQPLTQEWGTGSANIYGSWEYKADTLRLWRIKADKDSQTGSDLALLRYHYDESGNVTQLRDVKNAGQVQCFYYDDLHRLVEAYTSEDDAGTSDDCTDGYDQLGSGPYHYKWTFDQLGNVKTWTDVLGSNTETYTYGAGSAGPHAVTAFDGGTYGYDGNGNQTTRPNKATP